ncbi:unnamed protein product [Eruca vesicaria subsp. sativa]|uniref:Uncharacterized protein n=1 Tax=Eruca vesicaria subsp. sativa TaxID=29727 RepID=A0ABC8L456_ERUVS|nr:unnamed protein product [Eruca vesicaria subsp. sativa]
MAHYNKLSEICYNPKITAWRFRVKIHRIYPFYFYLTSSGPFYTYVLADEEATNPWFYLTATLCTQAHIIDPLNNRLFIDFKNIHAIPHMDHKDRNYPIDTMGVVFNTEDHFDDPANPRMVFYIKDNIRIKCVATGDHAYAFRDGLQNMRGRGQCSPSLYLS